MITEKALNKQCQDKGLDLHQNLTIGTRKVYGVCPAGTKNMLAAGYMGYLSKFVKSYQPPTPQSA